MYLTFLLLFISALLPKRFSNTYVTFDLPDSWQCKPEGGQHICQPINPRKRKEAIIIMAAKYKSSTDNTKIYFQTLSKRTNVLKDIKGKKYRSKKKYVKYKMLAGQLWVDAQFLNTEVPNFITRYMATSAKGLGILITFSAHKDKYKDYVPDFYKIVKDLKVNEDIPSEEDAKASVGLGDKSIFGSINVAGKMKRKQKSKKGINLELAKQSNGFDMTDYLIFGAGALVLLFLIKRLKNRG